MDPRALPYMKLKKWLKQHPIPSEQIDACLSVQQLQAVYDSYPAVHPAPAAAPAESAAAPAVESKPKAVAIGSIKPVDPPPVKPVAPKPTHTKAAAAPKVAPAPNPAHTRPAAPKQLPAKPVKATHAPKVESKPANPSIATGSPAVDALPPAVDGLLSEIHQQLANKSHRELQNLQRHLVRGIAGLEHYPLPHMCPSLCSGLDESFRQLEVDELCRMPQIAASVTSQLRQLLSVVERSPGLVATEQLQQTVQRVRTWEKLLLGVQSEQELWGAAAEAGEAVWLLLHCC